MLSHPTAIDRDEKFPQLRLQVLRVRVFGDECAPALGKAPLLFPVLKGFGSAG